MTAKTTNTAAKTTNTAAKTTNTAAKTPTAAEMAAYLARLEAWQDKLAACAIDGAISYTQALKACSRIEDAVALLNGTLDKVLAKAKENAKRLAEKSGDAMPRFTPDSWEYQRAIKMIYDNTKQSLRQYQPYWLPEGITIGQKKGRFVLARVQVRATPQGNDVEATPQQTASIDGSHHDLTRSQELAWYKARAEKAEKDLRSYTFERESNEQLIRVLRNGRDAYALRADIAERRAEGLAIKASLLEKELAAVRAVQQDAINKRKAA